MNLTISGIENIIKGHGNLMSFMYSGEINELVASLSGVRVSNLMIEEPSLDEIFMHYYK